MSGCCECCVAAHERGEHDHEPGNDCPGIPCDWCAPLEFFTDQFGRRAYRYLATAHGVAAGSEFLLHAARCYCCDACVALVAALWPDNETAQAPAPVVPLPGGSR